MRLKYVIPPLIIAMALLLAGCNIFGWTSGESAESKIDEGKEHLRNAEYEEALASFAEAMEEDPNSSEARYYHAKAAIHASGFNALYLAQTLGDNNFYSGSDFPFTGDDWPKIRANSLYQVSGVLFDDLRPIFRHETEGSFDSSDIVFDLGLAAGMKGLLMFQDTNLDGIIDNDDFNWLIEYLDGLSRGFEFSNLPEYINQHSGGAAKLSGSMTLAPLPIDPLLIAAFNAFVDNIAEIIDFAYAIIMSIATENFGVDPADVASVLTEAKNLAHYYRIADNLDNDNDSRIDEEIINGLDDDGDGRIDEDSDGSWELL
ncbi:MAG TPA: hypothetical protein PLF13_03685 [candidate division Zixibacteria bacterium]|nr:hypothetical protein [candidate division Zixibacteria bacterium]